MNEPDSSNNTTRFKTSVRRMIVKNLQRTPITRSVKNNKAFQETLGTDELRTNPWHQFTVATKLLRWHLIFVGF